MKVAIIGAGNMGGAIAKGLAQGTIIKNSDIIVADPDIKKLEQLQSHAPEISIVTQNQEAVNWADVIILAVKPWLVSEVLGQLRIDPERQLLISIAAGVSLEQLAQITSSKMTIFRLVPNTAISEMASMTLISSFNASEEQERQIVDIFNEMGLAMLIPESADCGNNGFDFLWNRLCPEIYICSNRSRSRDGSVSESGNENDCTVCKGSCRTGIE